MDWCSAWPSLLMRGANIDASTVTVARFMAVVVFPVMALYFVAQGASDTAAIRNATSGYGCVAHIPPLGIWLTAASAALLAGSLSAPAQRAIATYGSAVRGAAPVLVIAVSFVGAMVSGEISTLTPSFLMSPLS